MVRRFWHWWLGELADLAPQSVLAMLKRWRRSLLLEIEGNLLSVVLVDGDDRRLLTQMPFDALTPAALGDVLHSALAQDPPHVDDVILKIPEHWVLTRRLRLPIAARESLREAVEYDLDRQTPFTPDQVYFGVMERNVDYRGGHIEVELDLVRRTDLEPLLASLKEVGYGPDQVLSPSGQSNILPQSEQPNPFAPWRRATGFLALAVVGLALLAAWLPMNRVTAARENIADDVRRARAEALAVDELRRELQDIEARQTQLLERRRFEPMVVGILADMTKALPEDAFLIEFSYEGREVTVTGYAQTASVVLTAIEDSPRFFQARFISPVTPDQRVGRERFSLAAVIEPMETGAEVASSQMDGDKEEPKAKSNLEPQGAVR
ncbi:type II secretion system protein L [Iodidimonas muriae]|uniref:Type II secretion system protein L n=1 Tax=Iodidimonas muriae TaxID=261467 RepID=A0ABQ2L767_9PROT|nr:PilN domain-containing protein [Iodidimonas muriae]GER06634.1 type II secretion system protein L [Kordiimonadales bacterium JCM 17843]GGO05563.1 type II secretion system protein L [Iodidimonas muriae]